VKLAKPRKPGDCVISSFTHRPTHSKDCPETSLHCLLPKAFSLPTLSTSKTSVHTLSSLILSLHPVTSLAFISNVSSVRAVS